jgi:predicted enzyme related to lactoylglutathione lyase
MTEPELDRVGEPGDDHDQIGEEGDAHYPDRLPARGRQNPDIQQEREMSERDGFEPGVPCWVDTWQPDAEAATAFYARLFGWDSEDTMPADVPGQHFMCRLRGRDVAAIASRPQAAPPVPAWNTYIWVDDAAEAASKAGTAGGSVLMEAFESLDGGRIAVIADPAGATIGVWQPGAHQGAQLVNEPGAWSMSALSTSDPEACKRFYGAVFGWETETFDLGDAEMTMWKLPGYVGGEPQQPVARDVIATMVPPAGDAADASQWNVDFWIRNVDDAVSTAKELGGQVLSGPYDIPDVGMRQAVIADPQGAALSLTQPPGV